MKPFAYAIFAGLPLAFMVGCANPGRETATTDHGSAAIDRSRQKHSAALWLMPSARHRDALNTLILDLGRDYKETLGHGVPFSPAHATLASGSLNGDFNNELRRLKEHAANLCRTTKPVLLKPRSPGVLGHQAAWGTFMFVELELDDATDSFFSKAREFNSAGEAFRSPRSLADASKPMPHVSLMYSDPQNKNKLDWNGLANRADVARALRGPVEFNTLEIVVPDAPRFDWRELLHAPRSWRTLYSCQLGT